MISRRTLFRPPCAVRGVNCWPDRLRCRRLSAEGALHCPGARCPSALLPTLAHLEHRTKVRFYDDLLGTDRVINLIYATVTALCHDREPEARVTCCREQSRETFIYRDAEAGTGFTQPLRPRRWHGVNDPELAVPDRQAGRSGLRVTRSPLLIRP
jgi:hypothetical protein